MTKSGLILKIELAAAASPSRVQDVARLCVEMLGAMIPPIDAAGDAVTLVVSNQLLRAELRARSAKGRRAVGRIGGVLRNPKATARRSSEGANLVMVLAHRIRPLGEAGAVFRDEDDHVLAECDAAFAEKLEALVKTRTTSADAIEGSGTTITPVLQMGRTSLEGRLSARLRFDDGWHDVAVGEAAAEKFWNAAKTERDVVVSYRTEWVRGAKKRLQINHRRTVAFDVDEKWAAADEATVTGEADRVSEDELLEQLEDLGIEPWQP